MFAYLSLTIKEIVLKSLTFLGLHIWRVTYGTSLEIDGEIICILVLNQYIAKRTRLRENTHRIVCQNMLRDCSLVDTL